MVFAWGLVGWLVQSCLKWSACSAADTYFGTPAVGLWKYVLFGCVFVFFILTVGDDEGNEVGAEDQAVVLITY